MKYIIAFFLFCFCYYLIFKRFINPYKLYMIFGKKGSGKSSYLVKLALKYQKKKFVVYTNMVDLRVPGIRVIDIEDLGKFVPINNSVLLIDEAGTIYDNRNFRAFKPETRDFYKLQRHYKVICYLASQTYDVDIKLRALCDKLYLVQNIGIVFSLIRPIHKKVVLTESLAEGESRISENLKFDFISSWRLNYIPKYAKYFESFQVPELPEIKYDVPVPVTSSKRKLFSLK